MENKKIVFHWGPTDEETVVTITLNELDGTSTIIEIKEEGFCENDEELINKLIGNIIEIYIDDVVVKSKGYKEHLADLWEILDCTRKHGLKMNPNKCAFGVSVGQFLGFMVHEREIEIGQKSMKAIDKAVPRLLKPSYNLCLVRLILLEGLFQVC